MPPALDPIEPPPDPKALLQAHGLWAKKSFGQNFLRDYVVHARIASALGAAAGDTVVELGSGLGTLTWFLAQGAASRVVAIERDRDLAPILREVMARFPQVEVTEADAKQVRYADFAPQAPGRLFAVGNIPYHLTSPIVFALFEQRAALAGAALLVQREVADRILAPAGSRTYGLLSVLLGAVAELRRVCVVPRGAFHPAPRVDSAVLAWRYRPDPFADAASAQAFVDVVKRAFQQRRKTLKNALSGLGAERVAAALFACGIKGERRPETLSAAEYVGLSQALARR